MVVTLRNPGNSAHPEHTLTIKADGGSLASAGSFLWDRAFSAQCGAMKRVHDAARADPEMIESCLQAFESFVLRCPREVAPFQQTIGQVSLKYLSHDPNYDDGDDMEDDEEFKALIEEFKVKSEEFLKSKQDETAAMMQKAQAAQKAMEKAKKEKAAAKDKKKGKKKGKRKKEEEDSGDAADDAEDDD